jgi:hypothetical protein
METALEMEMGGRLFCQWGRKEKIKGERMCIKGTKTQQKQNEITT